MKDKHSHGEYQGRPVVNVAAGIVWRGDTFLAARRPLDGPRGGYWEFPGGKQEPGESIEQALARELEEELGMACGRIVPWEQVYHPYKDICVRLHFMHVLEFSGEPHPRIGQELRWITPAEALALEFLPADREVLLLLTRCGAAHWR